MTEILHFSMQMATYTEGTVLLHMPRGTVRLLRLVKSTYKLRITLDSCDPG
jgi:hypothetical protein